MDVTPIAPGGIPLEAKPDVARRETEIRETAQAFEAAFLSEMLKHSGINATPDGFGGGAGEDAFSSLLTQEYARLMTERGGIGLAEQIFQALNQRSSGP